MDITMKERYESNQQMITVKPVCSGHALKHTPG